MTGAVSIRPFEAADLSRLHEIREAAFRPVFQSFRQTVGEAVAETEFDEAEAEQGAFLDDCCKSDSSHKVFVALKGSEIIGFMAVSLDEKKKIGEIGLNAVHPSHAGQGVGRQLFGFATKLMREAGMKVATVGTGGR